MTDDKNRRPDDPDALRTAVSEGYARVAEGGSGCCSTSCCSKAMPQTTSLELGYESDDLNTLPDGADLGLGCGAPVVAAELKPGETVLDLGSGAGIDAFLAVREVGSEGRVIGVDMTDAMIEKARANAEQAGHPNVEFRKGLIEDLPVDDASVDAILSNCVINLSPEKDRVFREAYRVLRPGGRMVFSDIVLEEALPESIAKHIDATVGCVGNAALRDDYLKAASDAGFGVEILAEGESAALVHSIQVRIDISIKKHATVGMAIVGHEDCGGNPVDKPAQLTQLIAARKFLRETYPDLESIALWVDLKGNVEELD